MTDETRSALDDLAEKLKNDDADEADRLAQAAAERKKAESSLEKRRKSSGKPRATGLTGCLCFSRCLYSVITAAVVFLMVYWK